MKRLATLAAFSLLVLARIPLAQAPAPGLRLVSPLNGTEAWLMDLDGNRVHTWTAKTYPGSLAAYLLPDGKLLRSIKSSKLVLHEIGGGGGLQRLDFEGNVEWDFRYDAPDVLAHHDIEPLPNGNVLMIAWRFVSAEDAIADGRAPFLIDSNWPWFLYDSIIEVRPTGPTTGEIVWEWCSRDHLVQDFDPSVANWGTVADHPELVDVNFPPLIMTANDWNHINSVDYDPVHDWIVLSVREQDEIWIIDHSTTTAEAAGHTGGNHGKGGDLLYRWGNPVAYRAGTFEDRQLFGQHSADLVDEGLPGAGNIIFFNNFAPGGSQVSEIELPLDAGGRFVRAPGAPFGPAAPVWTYADPGLFSPFMSGCERLPNGNTLICASLQHRLLEVTPAGQIAWSHVAPAHHFYFQSHFVERTAWIDRDTVSAAAGAVTTFEWRVGPSFADDYYLLLGSTSGTSPGFFAGTTHVPLQVDGWTLTMATNGNMFPIFKDTKGRIGPAGDVTASFWLPGGILPPAAAGLRFDFSFVQLSTATGLVDIAPNAVVFVLVR